MKRLGLWLCFSVLVSMACMEAHTRMQAQSAPLMRTPEQRWKSIAQPGIASPQCVQCRQNCSDAMRNCKRSACESNGGKDAGPNGCTGVTNQQNYAKGLAACDAANQQCWNSCAQTVCK